MCRRSLSKLTSCVVAALHLAVSVIAVAPGLVHAQSTDVDPPAIELETVNEGVRGETQVFSASVTDNDEVRSMTLYYRFGNAGEYSTVPMSVIQGTDIYTASVDTDDASASLIQYYLEAKDAGGNRTVQGFAFDPFERVLLEEAAIVADAAPVVAVPVVAPSLSTQRKIAYGLLGLLVVGAFASASGGSSGGSSDPGQVDVKIVVDRFQ